MSKVTIQLGFYFENQHYAQVEAFIPRTEAIKIPQLNIEQYQIKNPKNHQNQAKSTHSQKNKKGSSKKSKSEKSQSKKGQSQDQNQNDDFQNPQNQMDVEDDGLGEEGLQQIQADLQVQMEQQKLMKYLQDQSDEEDDDDDMDDLSSLSKSLSVIRSNHKTKRQKGQKKDLMELPDRRPRKDKTFDEANEVLRRQQKQIKRKTYLKKQVQALEKATLDKILNETGKKLKMREEKQYHQTMEREHKVFKKLGDVPKFITRSTEAGGQQFMIHKTGLFPQTMLRTPQIKMKQPCSKCGTQVGKYKMKTTNGIKFACSLNCYKMIC